MRARKGESLEGDLKLGGPGERKKLDNIIWIVTIKFLIYRYHFVTRQ